MDTVYIKQHDDGKKEVKYTPDEGFTPKEVTPEEKMLIQMIPYEKLQDLLKKL